MPLGARESRSSARKACPEVCLKNANNLKTDRGAIGRPRTSYFFAAGATAAAEVAAGLAAGADVAGAAGFAAGTAARCGAVPPAAGAAVGAN